MDVVTLNKFFFYLPFLRNKRFLIDYSLREKCPNTEYLSVFSANAGKYGPEKTPDLNTFHAVYFTGSKFRIIINSSLAILMMPQPQNFILGSRRPQVLQFFLPECRRMNTAYASPSN